MSVDVPEFDSETFMSNLNRLPAEELFKYAGQCVAYSLDGTRILASGATGFEVEAKLAAAGIDPSRVVHDSIDPLDSPELL